jgi:hypothetical protein
MPRPATRSHVSFGQTFSAQIVVCVCVWQLHKLEHSEPQCADLYFACQSDCKELTVTVQSSHRYAISDNCLFAPSVECLVSAQVWGCL